MPTPKLRAGGVNDRGFSYLMRRLLMVKPGLGILSPKTEAAYEAFMKKHSRGEKKVCSKQYPMPPRTGHQEEYVHPDAVFEDRDGDRHDQYRCPHCNAIIIKPV